MLFCAKLSYAQLVVYNDGKVVMHGPLLYIWDGFDTDVVQFGGNVSIFGRLYTDFTTGVDNNAGAARLSAITTPAISACRQLYALSNDTTSHKLSNGISFERLKETFPNLTRVSESGRKSVDYLGLIPVLIQAINELQDEVRNLEKQLNTLKTAE